jgi:Fur family ferric uptake transcriptional regulator
MKYCNGNSNNLLDCVMEGLRLLEESYKLLKEREIRITPQRKAILEILYDHRGEHLEIEDIHRMLSAGRGDTSRTGLATVYRAIELFQRVGLVYRLPMDNSPGRYEFIGPRAPDHHHLICLECGRVEEIDDRLVDGFKKRIMKAKGFTVSERPIKVYGYCRYCKKRP